MSKTVQSDDDEFSVEDNENEANPEATALKNSAHPDLELRNNDVIYWLATKNFFAITKYNRSYKYAAAVLELAEALKNKSDP